MKRERRTRKQLFTAGISAATCVAVLITGTFAWQSISQTAKNEIVGDVNPGGRLHDDFNGTNKDIYVENFMQENEGGVPLLVRIRLYEYMEIGDDAGKTDSQIPAGTSKKATSVLTGGKLEDVSTWHLHKLTAKSDAEEDTIHAYWDWSYGGQTTYMPTFNKNKDSLTADINGTYEGKNTGDAVHFDDYQTYSVGDKVSGSAIYDADSNDVEEKPGTEGVNYTKKNEEHEATVTINGSVITMEQWKQNGCEMGDFWVYDEDGWAYWANPLYPGTATGLLLDGIKLVKKPSQRWYYGIYVDSQMVTADDLNKDDNTGFYDTVKGSKPSTDAEILLNQIVDKINKE